MNSKRYACAAIFLCASCSAQTPLTITGVTNSADFKPGFSQKGGLTSIFLTGLQGPAGTYAFTPPLPTDGYFDIAVWVNFDPAPMLSVSFQKAVQQIDIQLPWEGQRDPLYVEVFQSGSRATFEGPYTSTGFGLVQNWSVLFVDAAGRAVVQHASDYSLVTPQNPARSGEGLIAYGINLGPVTNVPRTGYAASTDPPSVFSPTAIDRSVCGGSDEILVGSSLATPTYDGLAPGLVGIYQLNFQVPADALPGDVPLAVQRTLIQFPFGTCQPDSLQTYTNTVTSASALIPIR